MVPTEEAEAEVGAMMTVREAEVEAKAVERETREQAEGQLPLHMWLKSGKHHLRNCKHCLQGCRSILLMILKVIGIKAAYLCWKIRLGPL